MGRGLPSFLAGGLYGRNPWFGLELSLGEIGRSPAEGFDPLEFWGEFDEFFAFGGLNGRKPWFEPGWFGLEVLDLKSFTLELSRGLGVASGRFADALPFVGDDA